MTNSMFSWQDSWKFASTICFPGSFYPNILNLLVQSQDKQIIYFLNVSIFLSIKTSVYTDSYKTSFCAATVMRKNKEGTIVNRWHSLFTNQTQTETQTNSYKFALLLFKYCVKL